MKSDSLPYSGFPLNGLVINFEKLQIKLSAVYSAMSPHIVTPVYANHVANVMQREGLAH